MRHDRAIQVADLVEYDSAPSKGARKRHRIEVSCQAKGMSECVSTCRKPFLFLSQIPQIDKDLFG